MKLKQTFIAGASLWLLLAASTRDAVSQQRSTLEGFSSIQWNFATPGARANGMGGTFVGVADDATAAITNPAGLISLVRPQVYVEGSATRMAVPHLLTRDSLTTLQTTETTAEANGLSFFAASAPVGSRLAVGFAAHRLLNFKNAFTSEMRFIPPDNRFVYLPAVTDIDYSVWSYVGTVAASLNDAVRVGVSVSVAKLDGQSFSNQYEAVGVVAGNILVERVTTEASSTGVGLTAGVMFKPNPRFSAGLTYAKGPSLKNATQFYEINPGSRYKTAGIINSFNAPLASIAVPNFSVDVPNRIAIGVSGRPHQRLLTAVDVVRVGYSRLAPGLFPDSETLYFNPRDLGYPNVTEVHLGGEYTLVTGPRSVLVRAGVAAEPDHGFEYTGTDNFARALYGVLPKETQVRGSLGGGIVLGRHAQMDLSYTWDRQFVASVAARF